MQFSKSKQIVLCIWVLTISVWSPLIWLQIFQTDFYFSNVRGLQNFEVSAPILLIVLCWAILLSIPKTRTRKNIFAAGSSLMSIGFLMQYYQFFHHTGGIILLFGGLGLLNTLKDNFKPL
ncbi:hypothetical protein ACO0LC_11260 [Undibacterium sp. JH2W]|uniref:hypothetical protein n=1 Tax=Undibacterium sp. JH2W TaxID=3413037 RepID=UPI003BF2998E